MKKDNPPTLNEVARALRMHPRTLCRALTGTDGSGWFADRHGMANLDRIAAAFSTTPYTMRRIVTGSVKLLNSDEAAKELGLRYWQLIYAVHNGHIVPTIARQRGEKQHWKFDSAYIARLKKKSKTGRAA